MKGTGWVLMWGFLVMMGIASLTWGSSENRTWEGITLLCQVILLIDAGIPAKKTEEPTQQSEVIHPAPVS